MYDSEREINLALKELDKFGDKWQAFYDELSAAVNNGKHSENVENLLKIKKDVLSLYLTAKRCLEYVDTQVSDVLEAENQFLEEYYEEECHGQD